MKIHILSLGCARALVDSEGLAGLLEAHGHQLTDEVRKAQCVVVNTCAFLQAAEEESIAAILEMAQLKRRGSLKRLYVVGCLPQKRRTEQRDLLRMLPEVDGFLGTGDLAQLPRLIATPSNRFFVASVRPNLLFDSTTPRWRMTPPHMAYLKISEGCDHACAFCSIPKFRGPHRSRLLEDLVEEAEKLAQSGVVELNLIGQDTSYYGMDRYGRLALPQLLRRLDRIDGLRWIRILYAHPAHITPELIAAIRDLPKVVKYLDIPLQHISDRLLKAMRRETDGMQIRQLIAQLRKEVPQLVLRTTFIVGFPSETEEEVEELARFMEEVRFERVGIFPYSAEPNTPAERMPEQIPEAVKQNRFNRLMELQQKISESFTQQWVGRDTEVLVEEPVEQGTEWIYLGRTYADAPEVDGQVFLHSPKPIPVGSLIEAKVIDATEYDWVARVPMDSQVAYLHH